MTYEISKSSLLSLKAEILRKEEDLVKSKQENVEKIKTIRKKALEFKNKGVESRQQNDLTEEEQDLLKLSRSRLEAKSKLYDKLSRCQQNSEEVNRRFLVSFNDKQKEFDEEEADLPVESEEDDRLDSDYDDNVDAANEWIEYTDCLGRSRKCLRKDLLFFKAKDADLRESAEKRQQVGPNLKETEPPNCVETKTENDDDKEKLEKEMLENSDSELLSADMRREMLRRQWEQEEEELRSKTDVHYQNVLFNEARQHGVGYYAFSKDEEERAKQQEALKQLRLETEKQQKKSEDLKALREKQMAARMKAAENRRRARLGLPPVEDEPVSALQINEEIPEKTNQAEDEKKRQNELLLEEARKRHIRPWDIGKDGIKEHYEMSQHEWNEKKRQDRHSEFAPPTAYSDREFSSMKTLECNIDERDRSLKFSSKGCQEIKDRKVRNMNPYKTRNDDWKHNEDALIADSSKSLVNQDSTDSEPDNDVDNLLEDYQSSKSTMEPTPIVNEIPEPILISDKHEEKEDRKRAEVSPPPTYDYYGPSSRKRMKTISRVPNISDSIEAGLKFLRDQTENKRKRPVEDIF